jgi:hypothetical protein
MAGNGKNSNYKEKIASHYLELTDVVLVKSRLMKSLYTLQEVFG